MEEKEVWNITEEFNQAKKTQLGSGRKSLAYSIIYQ